MAKATCFPNCASPEAPAGEFQNSVRPHSACRVFGMNLQRRLPCRGPFLHPEPIIIAELAASRPLARTTPPLLVENIATNQTTRHSERNDRRFRPCRKE